MISDSGIIGGTREEQWDEIARLLKIWYTADLKAWLPTPPEDRREGP
jgi:hypothetical protein